VGAPARRAAAVVPHDTNAIADIPKALFVGTGGDLVVRGVGGGADVTFKNVGNGTLLPVRAEFIRAAGTTAQHIVALY
jgi:hypothetical protein